MSKFHQLIGCVCPNCNQPLKFSEATRLLGDETVTAPIETMHCPNCHAELRAKGNRWDQLVRLGLVYLLPAFIVYLFIGTNAALVLNLLLFPFGPRVVGIDVIDIAEKKSRHSQE